MGGRNKRNKQVTLTKTKKQDQREKKLTLVEVVKGCLKKYQNLYLFTYQNMSTNFFRQIQEELNDSKFIIGKNKVLQKFLGKDESCEKNKNLHKISEKLVGETGLFFSNKTEQETIDYFNEKQFETFAKPGTVSNQTIILQKNSNVFAKMSHSIEPYLRKLGLPTQLVIGEIQIIGDYILCEDGKQINAEQSKILKLLGHKLGLFKINIEAVWKKNGTFKAF